jgi:glutamine synthetase adenylyltransferase
MSPPIAPVIDALAPDWFDDSVRASAVRLAARVGDDAYEALCEVVAAADQSRTFHTLMAGSDFFVDQAGRQSAWLSDALADGTLLATREWTADQWDAALVTTHGPGASESDCLAALRTFRHQNMVRILWREAAQLATVEDTFAELSGLSRLLHSCCGRFCRSDAAAEIRVTDRSRVRRRAVLGGAGNGQARW